MNKNTTVGDCLNLPALREAELIAGAKGLNRPVSSVSVLEWPVVEALSKDVLIGNEFVISALVQIKDDVEKQCDLIRHLSSMGTACLAIFYAGMFLPEVSKELIKTADEMEFPIILMPRNRMDFRYSDVITDVTVLLHTQRIKGNYYLTDVVKSISLLDSHQKTINGILRLLSDRLRCTLMLVDRNMEKRGTAPWPASQQWDYEQIINALKEDSKINKEDILALNVYKCDVNSQKHSGMQLIALSEDDLINDEIIQQASDVIALILNIWNEGETYDRADDFIGAVLNDNPVAMKKLAAHMNISIEVVNTMWIFDVGEDKIEDEAFIKNITIELRKILQEYHKIVIIDKYHSFIIAFTDKTVFESSLAEIGNEIINRIHKIAPETKLCIFDDMENTNRARQAYISATENMSNMYEIYPRKVIFTESELRFVKDCLKQISFGVDHIADCMQPINKIAKENDGILLIETLCTYLLDAESNTSKTGELLYLHKNTVNYRLNKIRNIINVNLTHLPVMFDIYRAVGIFRLINETNKKD